MAEGLEIGGSFKNYRIVSKIGAGGMGEVFLAEDTELGRQVALKVLLSEVAGDEDRIKRFVQEAKAASALNHPNILTVYEIGSYEGSRYIATELIKGETLRDRLHGEPMTLREVLDVAMQVAAALNAAHNAGIVHRDIKPENIMLRDDGIVKVLDFGLAKLTATPVGPADSEDATRAQVNTRPGVVMGTVLYMSPEQARGKETDARCDVWSLGVVMYEMLTKQTPFAGETANDSIAAILTREPPPLDDATPLELRRIVRKSLQKQTDERYQTVKDLLLDVKNLKRDLEFSEELERSHIPQSTGSSNVSTAQMSENATAIHSGVISTQNSMRQQRSSAEYLVSQVKEHKKGVLLGLSLLVLVIAGIAFGIYKYAAIGGSASKELSLVNAKVTKLTTSGRVSGAAISPDGKYVVHIQEDGDNKRSLYVRQVSTDSNIKIVPSQDVGYGQLRFSPEGDFVYYGVRGSGNQLALYQVPTLGGTPKKILDNFWAHISFSPDGKKFAFERGDVDKHESLLIANTDGTGQEKLIDVTGEEGIDNLAWSPDGKVIVYEDFKGGDHKLMELRLSDRSIRPLTDRAWAHVIDLAWSGSESLLMLAQDRGDGFQIWRVSYPGGAAERLTNDPDGYTSLSVTRDFGTISVVKTLVQSGIWVAPANNVNSGRALTSGSGKLEPTWVGNRIFFISRTTTMGTNKFEICSVDADGGNRSCIPLNVNEPADLAASPDGKFLTFTSGEGTFGSHYIWRMNSDGSDLRQITKGDVTWGVGPRFTPDGQWLYFFGDRPPAPPFAIWKVASDGTGEPIRVSDGPAYFISLSPDGKYVAYMTDGEDPKNTRTALAPVEGGSPIKYFPKIRSLFAWTTDSRSLTYSETSDFIANFMSQPISGGEPKKLTDFRSDRLFSLDYSPDGRQLAFSRGTVASDVLLYTNFK